MGGKKSLLATDDEGNDGRGAFIFLSARTHVIHGETERTWTSWYRQWSTLRPLLAVCDETHGASL